MSKDDKHPSEIEVYDSIRNIYELKEKIKDKMKPGLDHLAASDLHVYPKQTDGSESLPWDNNVDPIPPRRMIEGEIVPGDNEYLIVLAKRPQEEASQQTMLLQEQLVHRNVGEGVFVLYRGDDGDAQPIGTAFAISGERLLTACHNAVVKSTDGKSDSEIRDLKISTAMTRKPDGKISADSRGRPVSVHSYNILVDWASLELKEKVPALPFAIPLATADSDMPVPATSEKIYIYHCPVQLFLDDPVFERCHVMKKEASVAMIGPKTLSYQNGAFPGSCGGPYIFRNKAVALHTESVSTTKTAEDIKTEASDRGRKRKLTESEVTRMMVDSCVSDHASLGSGIVLHVRSGIMELLE